MIYVFGGRLVVGVICLWLSALIFNLNYDCSCKCKSKFGCFSNWYIFLIKALIDKALIDISEYRY